MDYFDVLGVKVGDVIKAGADEYYSEWATVLEVKHDQLRHKITFVVPNGKVSQDEVWEWRKSEDNQLKDYLKTHPKVFISRNNNGGHYKYCVVPPWNPSYTLGSFDSREEANAFIEQHGLPKVKPLAFIRDCNREVEVYGRPMIERNGYQVVLAPDGLAVDLILAKYQTLEAAKLYITDHELTAATPLVRQA